MKPKSKRIPPGAPGHGSPPVRGPSPEGRGGGRAGPAPKAEPAPRSEGRGPGPGRGQEGRRLRFLYEDRDILVVEKPAGLPSIAPEGSRARTAYDLVTERIRRTNPRGRAAAVHRLDRDTSGVMVFAANAGAKKILMEGWSELVPERRYAALVEGELAEEGGRIESWLAEAGPSRMRIAGRSEPGAQRALLEWRLLARGAGYSLLEISLDTGRKHQIRVQLASIGHPVAGDGRYGARSDPAGRLMLHASLLELIHPQSGERLRFESPPPPEFREALREPRTWSRPERGPEAPRERRGK